MLCNRKNIKETRSKAAVMGLGWLPNMEFLPRNNVKSQSYSAHATTAL